MRPTRHSRTPRLLTLLLLICLLLPVRAHAAPPEPGAPPVLRLRAGTFAPAAGEQPALPPGLLVAVQEAPRAYAVVQFAGPVAPEQTAALQATGVAVVGYLPDFAYKVRATPAQARAAGAIDGVLFVGDFVPAYKISPALRTEGASLYRVRTERGADAGPTQAAIAASGAALLAHDGDVLLVWADWGQVQTIAQVADVAWIEGYALRVRHNEGASGLVGGAWANAQGYDGSSQIVAVADTGLGGGSAATAHAALPPARVAALFNWAGANAGGCYSVVDDGPVDVDSGHGTHVALSLAGSGAADGTGRGMAPAARLLFQAVEQYVDFTHLCALQYADGYALMGLPEDLRLLYQQAYDAGARVHSSAWGSAAAGDYTLDSAAVDAAVWTNRDLLISVSAGNEGTDADRDGVVDSGSLGSPATAKNVLTVGASENRRAAYPCDAGPAYSGCSGENAIARYGESWPADFAANPLKDDPAAGGAGQMAAFSSRGPTDDGRIKPDVVAPGTWLLSGYAELFQQGYDADANPRNGAWQYDGWGFPQSAHYKYMGGTSMANSIAAGAAVLVRDFYAKAHGHNASAALVKATLIQSAVDLPDENNDGQDDNAFPIPNVHEGWGRVELANALDGRARFVDDGAGLVTGGAAAYSFALESAGPLRISLVWSDREALETAAVALVNDLDLKVTAPDGTVYFGNAFAGGWSQPALGGEGSPDRRNNVENVYVQEAARGAWTVEVLGYNVPLGPQPFALVVGGAATALTPAANEQP